MGKIALPTTEKLFSMCSPQPFPNLGLERRCILLRTGAPESKLCFEIRLIIQPVPVNVLHQFQLLPQQRNGIPCGHFHNCRLGHNGLRRQPLLHSASDRTTRGATHVSALCWCGLHPIRCLTPSGACQLAQRLGPGLSPSHPLNRVH